MSKRDPEGRRRKIVEAAGQLIAEVGVTGLTHRLVAARAEVPLGATTYYFTSLDDLSAAALRHLADETTAELDGWAAALDAGADVPATLARLMADYLADRGRALLETELYVAAARRAELRPLARAWGDGLARILAAHADPAAGRAVAVFLDGVLVHALVRDEPLDLPALTASLTKLLSGSTPARPRPRS
ncbi:TetR/AcrR family transcriptional regulator [Phytohabitans houttuyneae]|uniref:DNA-binding transcriptional regulator n=1 Tax=Phytohabitans houttuyneae TaxID=1076126 RepID=A0A6V8K7C2_9ACTN|nr:TetR family transcriptional regulator [Phytohabitans houttuyneae]GFJ79654.1 DNA-binding transcriptional regulator [Phytohabitans houttuyneae]